MLASANPFNDLYLPQFQPTTKKHKPKGPVHQLCSFKMKVFSKKYVAENIAKLLQASTNTDIYPFLNLPILLSFRCFFE